MPRNREWRRGRDEVMRHLERNSKGVRMCEACIAESWIIVGEDERSDHAVGVQDACNAVIERGHTCRDRGQASREKEGG